MTTLKKIRKEIEQLKNKPLPFDGYDECVKYALHIIDKYADQEPCDDAISRQAVLKIAKQHTLTNDYLAIQNLPSVRPQEQTGKWIKLYMSDTGKVKHKCSLCGFVASGKWKYCCECGARMVEPQESKEI